MSVDSRTLYAYLEQKGIYSRLFDACRLVDPERGLLLELCGDGTVRDTATGCYAPFGVAKRCKNCVSARAIQGEQPVFKLEYVEGMILLVFAVPMEHEGRRMVVEMSRSVTDSMSIDVQDAYSQGEIGSIIQDLNRIATTDALTGLFNRRFIDTKLPETIANCHRYGPQLCVAMLDLDNFKQVNDLYLHQGGDEVLSSVAGTISLFVRRSTDWSARYGGEEFLICLLGCDCAKAVEIMERLRQAIAGAPVATGPYRIPVTASIGLSMMEPGDDMKTLLARCDRLMYQAKRKGKNRVEYALEN